VLQYQFKIFWKQSLLVCLVLSKQRLFNFRTLSSVCPSRAVCPSLYIRELANL